MNRIVVSPSWGTRRRLCGVASPVTVAKRGLDRGFSFARLAAWLGLARRRHLAKLAFTFPARHVRLVQGHEALGHPDHVSLRRHVEDRIAADDLFGLGERAVGDR